ncbi:hypothetical protein NDK43_09120 [Neobacillus pocheonensis]|uniref:Uncharacterized protein n=1 Tax=Neobacillus pocheonensis TaxID=363869 RepID=A0ABT0W864_9BACI|nr:hypothetical protein [Neobacillus pocheonensis]
MLGLKQEYIFKSIVSEKASENEFVVEFFSCDTNVQNECQPLKVTHNFDELIDFFEELED